MRLFWGLFRASSLLERSFCQKTRGSDPREASGKVIASSHPRPVAAEGCAADRRDAEGPFTEMLPGAGFCSVSCSEQIHSFQESWEVENRASPERRFRLPHPSDRQLLSLEGGQQKKGSFKMTLGWAQIEHITLYCVRLRVWPSCYP